MTKRRYVGKEVQQLSGLLEIGILVVIMSQKDKISGGYTVTTRLGPIVIFKNKLISHFYIKS